MNLILRILFLFILFCLIMPNSFALADDQINLKIVDRLARIEEGQKAIISEMQTRSKAVDQRFESMEKRFDSMEKRFDTLLLVINQRFESLQREMDKRFEAVDNRFEAVDKRIDQLNNFMIAVFSAFVTIFIALFTYAIWDRKTSLENAYKKYAQLLQDHNQKEHISIEKAQKKIDDIINIMKQMSEKYPEMRQMMQTANLL